MIERIEKIIISFLWLTIGIAFARAVFIAQWDVVFVLVIVAILMLLPDLLARRYDIHLPIEIVFVILVFIYATLFLGEVLDFYERFWWWDLFLHIGSAIALGLVGFVGMTFLVEANKMHARVGLVALFAFTFSFATAALWEVFEFSMDQLFNMTMQKSGLIDTMWDLIVATIGAALASIGGYFYVKNNRQGMLGLFVEKTLTRYHQHKKRK